MSPKYKWKNQYIPNLSSCLYEKMDDLTAQYSHLRKKWLMLRVLPLLICELSFCNVWQMDQWFHSNSNNINKVQIQYSSHQEYKS